MRWRRPAFRRSSRPPIRASLARWAVICFALGLTVELLGLFDMAELKTYDLRAVRRASRPAPTSPDLVLVTVDDRSEELLGPFPWSHDVYASLVQALDDAGSRGALLVLYFNREEPNAESWESLRLPLYVIQPFTTSLSQSRNRPPWVGGRAPLPREIASAHPVTSFSVFPPSQEDGVRRHVQAVVEYGFRRDPAYALELLFAADILGVSPDSLDLPLDAQGRLLLPRSRAMLRLPSVSLVDALGATDAPTDVKAMLRGRWAIVGVNARADLDYIRTTFGEQTALDIRAAAVNTILTRDFIRPRSASGTTLLFVLWGLVFGALGIWLGRRPPSPAFIWLIGLAAILVHVLLAAALFQWADRWIPVVSLVVTLAATSIAWTLATNAARLRTAERRAFQAEREAAFGMMTAQVRHEMRNLLNSIRSPAEMVKRNFARGDPLGLAGKPDALCDEMDVIIERVTRLSEMVEEELSFLHPDTFQFEKGDLWELLLEAKALLADELDAAKVEVQSHAPEERARLSLDPAKMRIAFVNLIRNAMQAMPDGGILSLTYDEPRSRLKRRRARVRLSDTGVGMDAEQLDHLFEPFYTTKARGLGLGLLSAKNVVETHGGEIRVESSKGHGTTFEVIVPIASSAETTP